MDSSLEPNINIQVFIVFRYYDNIAMKHLNLNLYMRLTQGYIHQDFTVL